MNLTPFLIAWVVLASFVLVLAGYRRLVARSEDDFLHVREGDTSLVSHQASIAGRLDLVDKWGKALTVVAFAFGLILAALYVYEKWVETSTFVG